MATSSTAAGPHVLVVAGSPAAPRLPDHLPRSAIVIAADHGADHCAAARLPVHHLVGDLDSVSAPLLEALERGTTRIHRHPTDKAASDLDLALTLAAQLSPLRLDLYSGGGGRLDHAAIELALLGRADIARLPITAHIGATTIAPVAEATRELPARHGDTVSLQAVGGVAIVSIVGVRWELERAELRPGSTLGLSNVALDHHPTVTAHRGTVLAFVTPCTT